MRAGAVQFRCHGCGATIDPALALPFCCPNAFAPGDDIDHVLAPSEEDRSFPAGAESNPFVRYRRLLSPYRLARKAELSDAAWIDLVESLDAALARVDGRGFRITPMAEQAELAKAMGIKGALWVKDETGNVSGSHKARHLMGVMLYLRVLEMAKLPAGDGLRARRLAIASCGNAALAAAVIARAGEWPLDVFIPPDAEPAVKQRLLDLGARISVCERRAGEAGDPCVLRCREAVARGAIPFGVQGTENALAVEGARTLAFEMAEAFRAAAVAPDLVYVQVGGGALASALAQGFAIAARLGVLAKLPRLMAVQTAGCAPLERAWRNLDGRSLEEAARHRSRFMWPWERRPVSLASGILDDETYDWWAVVEGMRHSGGRPLVVDEQAIERAWEAARQHTEIHASATGTAGLAGAASMPDEQGTIAVIFSGVER
ncbi:MAG: pyridoxal-phosphate dependent enzyme [Betaproteobacteria bacterium]|nr:pyridoxal-phosphate dependent enzyme [Betaproteobacteria bacterium]